MDGISVSCNSTQIDDLQHFYTDYNYVSYKPMDKYIIDKSYLYEDTCHNHGIIDNVLPSEEEARLDRYANVINKSLKCKLDTLITKLEQAESSYEQMKNEVCDLYRAMNNLRHLYTSEIKKYEERNQQMAQQMKDIRRIAYRDYYAHLWDNERTIKNE